MTLGSHFPQLIVGVFVFYLGLFVITRKIRSSANVGFFVGTTATSIWLILYFFSYNAGYETARVLLRLSFSAVVIIGIGLYHFYVAYVDSEPDKVYVKLFYLAGLILCFLACTTSLVIDKEMYHYRWGYYPKASYLHPLYVAIITGSALRSGWLIFKRTRLKGPSIEPLEKARSRILIWSYPIFYLASIDFLPNYGIDIYPVGFLFAGIFVVMIFYAIVFYRLLDITIVLTRTLFYTLLVFVLTIVYVFIIFATFRVFKHDTLSMGYVMVSLPLLVMIIVAIKPIEIFLSRVIDRRFFKGTLFEISEKVGKLETELERTDRLKGVGIFAAGMAHEIKNPLTAISTFADYLPAKYDDPEFREKFSRIVKDEVLRVKDIVSNLLAFSKPQEPVKTICNLNPVLQDILDLLSNEILNANIKVRTSFEEQKVLIDPGQLKQAFLNIILNAIQAMKEKGGELLVQSRLVNKNLYLEILVQDTGCGIPANKLPHIFDPFFTDKEGGTGLGLSVTHSIIESNGGRIKVVSVLGEGTQFKITLKCHKI